VRKIIHKLETMAGGIICLTGLQGVGKSRALLTMQAWRMLIKDEEHWRTDASGKCPELGGET
jgi:hypothetical protein